MSLTDVMYVIDQLAGLKISMPTGKEKWKIDVDNAFYYFSLSWCCFFQFAFLLAHIFSKE